MGSYHNSKSVYEGINYFRSSEDNTNEDNYRISSEIDYSRVLSQYFKLSAGANYLHTNNRNHFLYSEEENRYKYLDNSITAYLDFNIDIKKLSFLLGINYFNQNKRFQDEDINIKSSYFFPKLSSIYSINSNNSLMLNCYSTQTLPTLWQLIGIPINITPNYIVKGNPYLKPENIMNVSLEYDYTKGSTFFSATLFYDYIKNSIVDEYSEIDNVRLLSTKTNLNRISRYGLSLSLNYDLFNWWSVRLGGDVVNRFIPENNYYKKNSLSVNSNITNVFLYKSFMLALKYEYNDKRLVYNGYYKPCNSSLAQLRYRLNPKVSFSIIWTQPIDEFKSESMIYYDMKGSYANHKNQIRTNCIIFSFTYNILKNNLQKNTKIYYNENKKY